MTVVSRAADDMKGDGKTTQLQLLAERRLMRPTTPACVLEYAKRELVCFSADLEARSGIHAV
ncbi:MAG TPA: hypothetical protein VJ717_17070 [Gemmatimonadaceae bacterium]|nr:hypothetical protein [Gemmatimonadaceae bacterium]